MSKWDKEAVFNFGDFSDKEDDNTSSVCKISEKPKTINKDDKDNMSDHESNLSYLQRIDYYDQLNFKRIVIKRNSRKGRTDIVTTKKNFNIEKFSEEIMKITEEVEMTPFSPQFKSRGDKERKRTIRFNTKRCTYQYPKEKESVKCFLHDKDTEYQTEEDEKKEEENLDTNFSDLNIKP